jgi:hypothetical protein
MTSRISIITPTCDRPFGIPLLEKYVREQSIQPHEWIVADGGQEPAKLTMGQTHIHMPAESGPMNLANNLIRGLRAATGDIIFIFEDDDVYLPQHIELNLEKLEIQEASGGSTLKYFNVAHRCYVQMNNKGSALCQTSFRSRLKHLMEKAAAEAAHCKDYCIDMRFWRFIDSKPHNHETVIGIKGLPGTKGLGIGHRPDNKRGWVTDLNMYKLKEWIGEERTAPYRSAYK